MDADAVGAGRWGRVLAALGALSVVVLAAVGVSGRSGPDTEPLGQRSDVVLVSVPGLRWQDLEASTTPHLDALLGAAALLSVRTVGGDTTAAEAYLTIGAGNRIDGDGAEATLASGRCVPDLLAGGRRSADDELGGAVPGALGDALAGAGVATSVFGTTSAVAALMDTDGCVETYAPDVPDTLPGGVVLVEFTGLEGDRPAAERLTALEAIDARVGALSPPTEAAVVLLAPTAVDDGAEVTVAAVSTGTSDGTTAELSSGTTRRAGYVTLADVAPTVLAMVGIDAPTSMNGTPIERTATPRSSTDRVAELADLADRVAFRDRAVGPVSVVMVVLLSLCGLAALGGRGRLARTLGPIVLAYPSVTFLMGLVDYHRLPLDLVVVLVPVVAAFVAAVVTSTWTRWGAWVPAAVLATLLWAVQVIDIVTGGRLQINTPLGYTPTIAGRFQGFGNLSFGLVGAAAVVVAVLAAWAVPGRRRLAVGWAVWAGVVTVVVDAAPRFGSDVGGTLALVPAVVVIASVLAGRRIGWRRAVLAAGATVGLVVVLAVIDLARPAASRTHLGRFADDLLHGDGGLVLRRKLRGNLSILTSSVWSVVLVALVVAAVVVAWRRRARLSSALRERVPTAAFLAGFATVAVLGFALNDSGIAIPAVMLAVGIPWIVATSVPITRRERP